MGHVALLALREDRLPIFEVSCLHRVEQLLQLVDAQRREELDLPQDMQRFLAEGLGGAESPGE